MKLRHLLTLIFASITLVSFGAKPYTVKTVPNISKMGKDNWVSNPDKLISAKTQKDVNELVTTYEKQSSREIAVVALNSIGNKDQKEFARQLFRSWNVGKQELKNGILILFVKDQEQLVFYIGEGLTYRLSDEICQQIQKSWLSPFMLSDDFEALIPSSVQGIIHYLDTGSTKQPLTAEEVKTNESINDMPDRRGEMEAEQSVDFNWRDYLLICIPIIIIFIYFYRQRHTLFKSRLDASYTTSGTSPAVPKKPISTLPTDMEPITIDLPVTPDDVSDALEAKSQLPKIKLKGAPVSISIPKLAHTEPLLSTVSAKPVEKVPEAKPKTEPELKPDTPQEIRKEPISSDSDRRREEERERQRKREEDKLADLEREDQRLRERGIERERELEQQKERVRERELEREREQERMRERERERERERDRGGSRTTW